MLILVLFYFDLAPVPTEREVHMTDHVITGEVLIVRQQDRGVTGGTATIDEEGG